MFEQSNPEIQFALNAVRQAVKLIRQIQLQMGVGVQTKKDRSPVTVADFAVQALIAFLLNQAFPKDLLVGEEDSKSLNCQEGRPVLDQVTRFVKPFLPEATPEKICQWIDLGTADTSERFWTLDPIDGTKGFLRGEQYVVALALIINGKVQIGILGCPNVVGGSVSAIGGEGSLVIAVRGKGTWCTPLEKNAEFIRLNVSNCRDQRKARIVGSVESDHTDTEQMNRLMCRLGVQAQPILMDSQVKHVIVASGAGDLFIRPLLPAQPEYATKIWDEAAGSLIVEEAGGCVTDLRGLPLDFSAGKTLARNRGLLVSNCHLHAAALEALGKAS